MKTLLHKYTEARQRIERSEKAKKWREKAIKQNYTETILEIFFTLSHFTFPLSDIKISHTDKLPCLRYVYPYIFT